MAVEQSSQVPVTPSVHQTTLSSFMIKANPTNVACQLLELSEEQLQEFAASRNTRKFAPIISKLICFQMSLTERFETLRLEEERVSATPAKPVSQMLLSPLVPATSPLQPDNIPLTLVQKWFRKMRDYMAAYEDGATGKTADKKVKQYRSHRQCFDKTPAGGSNLPEPIRLVERDSIIDLTELPSVEMVSSAAEDLGEIGM